MRSVFRLLLLFSLQIFAGAAYAEDKACLMEGSFTLFGTTTEIKDCIQNEGVSEEMLKSTCTSLSGIGAKIGATPAKITYMVSCPSSPQASCDGFFGRPMKSFYYKRDPSTLPDVRRSCEAEGGKWQNGTWPGS